MSRCRDCKFAEFQRTPTGRIKKGVAGRCVAVVPGPPVMLCLFRPATVHKSAIWAEYEGQCDLFEEVEK